MDDNAHNQLLGITSIFSLFFEIITQQTVANLQKILK